MSLKSKVYNENVVDAIMSLMSVSYNNKENLIDSIKISNGLGCDDDNDQIVINKNLLLTHSPFLRHLFGSFDDKSDFNELILPDFSYLSLKSATEVITMSWCAKKEIDIDKNV